MDYNERNGSYSDDELLSRFSRPETPRTTVQDDIPDDPAALRRDRGPRPGIRMASGRPMRGMKMQRPAGRKGGPNYRAALCGAVLAFFVIALLFFVLFMSRGGKIKELNSQIDTLGQDKQSLSAQITSLQQQVGVGFRFGSRIRVPQEETHIVLFVGKAAAVAQNKVHTAGEVHAQVVHKIREYLPGIFAL